MRVLVAIPHYFEPGGRDAADGRWHASLGPDPGPRIAAVTACITALHGHLGPSQSIIDIASRTALPANEPLRCHVDIVLCTTGGRHLLAELALPPGAFAHRPTRAEPPLLGYECHAALRDGLGAYDYYAYLEDDLIVRDPWFLAKLAWFNGWLGDGVLLQPNRFEVAAGGVARKAYLDGDLAESVAAPFQDRRERPELKGFALGREVLFQRPTNPHSGCFFLSARQMAAWAARGDFLDRSTAFVGPLESAATLGITRAFHVYKPAPRNASFLEIEHAGTEFIGLIRTLPADPGRIA